MENISFAEAVRIARDTEQMLVVLRRHLETNSASSSNLRIEDCRIERLRCRDGQRAVFQYAVRVRSNVPSLDSELVLTGSIHSAKDALWLKSKTLRQLGESVSQWTGDFCPVNAIPELNMLVQAFPFDRRLPALSSLVLSRPPRLLRALENHFGNAARNNEVRATGVRYRAGLAAVLRYDLVPSSEDNDAPVRRSVFAKVYRDSDEANRAYLLLQTLSALHAKCGIRFALPIACLPELATVLLQGAAGTTFEHALLQGDAIAKSERLAHALARLNQCDLPLKRSHSSSQQSACLQRALSRLRTAAPDLAPRIAAIECRLQASPAVPLKPTHRDLKPEHIFFDTDETITLIDCDSMALADPVIDPAMMLARITAMSIRHGLTGESRDVFAREYFRSVPTEWKARLANHYTATLLEIASGYYNRQETGWRDTIESLVCEAEASVTSTTQVARVGFEPTGTKV